ncbi:MAG: hypothetical protein HFG19_05590 [Oscillospiraceae bacterium]|nr:hypothetical protein [Oscillospiraceae bacterium]MCI9669132.1 hypothetical protein [Oscillospiraceae bacterium]
MTADIEKVLLNEEELHQKVKELGAQISKDYAGKPLLNAENIRVTVTD